jgi:hypothetical protein
MTTDERLDRVTGILETLAGSVAAHDAQIEGLITVAEKHQEELANLGKELANLSKQWQAYVNTLPRT